MFKRQARQQRAFCYIRFFNYEFFWFNSLTRAKDCCIIIKRSELTAPQLSHISWARSSVGRAFGSHPRGQGFESLRVHQIKSISNRLEKRGGNYFLCIEFMVRYWRKNRQFITSRLFLFYSVAVLDCFSFRLLTLSWYSSGVNCLTDIISYSTWGNYSWYWIRIYELTSCLRCIL